MKTFVENKEKTSEEKDFFRDVIMGPNGPLYWILIGAMIACGSIPAIAISQWLRPIYLETQCEKWVGNRYVFDDPMCYRVIDGKLHYVDIDLEKAIKEFEQRKKLNTNFIPVSLNLQGE